MAHPSMGGNERKEHFRKVQIIQQNSASALDPKIPVGKSIEEPLLAFSTWRKRNGGNAAGT